MPYLRVRLATPNQKDITAQQVASGLTNLAATILGKAASVAAVDVKFSDPARWFIGGQPLTEVGQSSFCVEIKVTAGTNSRDDKATFIRAVFKQMTAILGPITPTSYVVVQDVAADSWGYGGKTQAYRYISGDNG